MDAGDWQHRSTFHACYQQSNEETTLRVMKRPVKLVSKNLRPPVVCAALAGYLSDTPRRV
jgi:hypothetical protein